MAADEAHGTPCVAILQATIPLDLSKAAVGVVRGENWEEQGGEVAGEVDLAAMVSAGSYPPFQIVLLLPLRLAPAKELA